MSGAKLKAELPGGPPSSPPRPRRASWLLAVGCVALFAFFQFAARFPFSFRHMCGLEPASPAGICPQSTSIAPEKNAALWNELTALHSTDAFLKRAAAQLSAAVQIPTETYDAMGPVGEDPRWESRGPFVEHLATAFPLVHGALDLQKVNTYGLVYTWQGSDASLKPILLMGHYDVVPVAPLSADQWTHPAYSGHFDGEYIWGRGSTDDKSGVIGILTAIEVLLEKNFAPTRTVVLSFGFDEEASGYHGAAYLADALLERFGRNAFAMIVDEGAGFDEQFGAIFAAPGVAEKGYVDVTVQVQTPGGHSSIPPEHTSIGILAAMIVHLENTAPPPVLEVGTPPFDMAQCFAAHGPEMPRPLKRAILRAEKSKHALKKAEQTLLRDRAFRALVATTQPVDIVNGGVKSNALPEQAMAVINHRISTQNSVNATISRDRDVLLDLAAHFNLSVTAYGESLTSAEDAAAASGSLTLTAPGGLEPAPITSSTAAPYHILAGTIRATLNATYGEEMKDVFVTPGMMTGNTDTRWMWDLSEHIFRYGHWNGGLGMIHTVNERMEAHSFVGVITFITTLILNVDETAF
ncbi:hypothetical protein FB45DRAFT_889219 [Roridomyces roridus]|uniref:Peptidase M20 dimerisation domain-containing protein n=1 Tax=Roridomyces roridus TaxID=1738132 RepID=A0AAD7FZ49_9AGAR|nr:hypothetical protein FB45DRAFT_889219 [Roridomyces roridus]